MAKTLIVVAVNEEWCFAALNFSHPTPTSVSQPALLLLDVPCSSFSMCCSQRLMKRLRISGTLND